MAIAGIIAAVAAVVGTALATYSQIQASQQQAKAAEAVSKQKSIEAETARQSAMFDEEQHRRKISLLLGQQQAIYGASGIDTSSGSPLFNEIDLVKQGELEALNIKRGGTIVAGGRTFEANIAKYQRDIARGALPLQIAGGVFSAVGAGAGAYSSASNAQYRRSPQRSVLSDWGSS